MDEADALERQMRGRKRMARVAGGVLAAATLVLGGVLVYRKWIADDPDGHHLSAAQQAAVRRDIEAARAGIPARDLLYRQRMVDAVARLGPRPDLGKCPVELPWRDRDHNDQPQFPLHLVRRADLGKPFESAYAASVDDQASTLEQSLGDRGDDATLADTVRGARSRLEGGAPFEVVMVIDREVRPLGDRVRNELVPGALEGRAFLWDRAKGEVMCAADVAAHSSSYVAVQFSSFGGPFQSPSSGDVDAALRADLEAEAERAVSVGMTALAGPAR